jgi:hypothetical protein
MASDVAGAAHGADSAGAAGLGGLRAGARTGAGELPLAAAEDSARPSSANCTSRVPVRPAARTPAATTVPCHRTATSRCSSSCKSQMMSATVVVSSASYPKQEPSGSRRVNSCVEATVPGEVELLLPGSCAEGLVGVDGMATGADEKTAGVVGFGSKGSGKGNCLAGVALPPSCGSGGWH